MTLPVPSSSWTFHPCGSITPLGAAPSPYGQALPLVALTCANCGETFRGRGAKALCSSRCQRLWYRRGRRVAR